MTNYLIALAVTTAIAVVNGVLMYRYAKRRLEWVTKAALDDSRARSRSASVARQVAGR